MAVVVDDVTVMMLTSIEQRDVGVWCYCELCSTVLVHYKTHVSPISTCLEWGCPLLAVGDLKMREPNARSKAPIL